MGPKMVGYRIITPKCRPSYLAPLSPRGVMAAHENAVFTTCPSRAARRALSTLGVRGSGSSPDGATAEPNWHRYRKNGIALDF